MGGLSLLAGLLLIWSVTGAADMSALLAAAAMSLRDSPLYLAALVLVLGGAFTKSAQFPFHFWLPNAMQAPTPVSAYLHSATMVKAGVYLLMRLNPVMGGTAAWETILPLFGGATLIVGTVLAMRQTDLKLMLAYTTVGSLGLLVMLTGFGSDKAVEAAVLYLIAHSLFKGALFMVAGTDRPRGRHARHRRARRACAAPCRSPSPRRLLAGAVDGRPAAVLRLPRQGGDLRGARLRRRMGERLHARRACRQCADVDDRLRPSALKPVPRRRAAIAEAGA